MNLLERDADRSLLATWRDQAAAGEGRLVLLGGEAGVGKTSLVRAFCGDVPPSHVLSGGCDPLSTPRPLQPLLDMAGQLGGELEELLDHEDRREQAFRSFLATLQRAGGPWVVVFEDVHWADEATLDLLRFLARRIGTARALVIASYRHDEIGSRHPLRMLLGDLATLPEVRKHLLRPLGPEAVRTLAAGHDMDATRLYALTDGNPFYVTEVLATGDDGVPGTVRDAVLARAGRLSLAARDALDGAAVIGARIEPSFLASLTGASDDAVAECLESGILTAQGATLAFRHELARSALLDTVPLPKRLSLHGRLLRILEEADTGADQRARLAHHAEEARDAAAVLRHALEAGRHAASLGAHREAVAQFARALRFAGPLAPEDRAPLLVAFARSAGLIDATDQAIPALQEACAIWRTLAEPLREAETLCELAFWSVRAGRNAEAEVASSAALERLTGLPPNETLARAYTMQGYLRMLHRDARESVAWCRKALELPEELLDTELEVETRNALGTAQVMGGDDADGVANLLLAASMARDAGIRRLEVMSYGLLGTGSGELYLLDRAERYLTLSIELAGEHDLDSQRLYSASWLALVHLYLGRWDRAAEVAASVVRRPGAAAVSRLMALLALGRLRARRGDPEAGQALDAASELAEATGTLQRIAPTRCARAEAAWLAGDAASTAAEASAAFELARHHRHPWFVGEMAYWRWKAGASGDVPVEAAEPFAMQIRGRWREAAARWSELGCPYEEARALAEGDDVDALKRALATFERLGARPASADTARRLRALGATGIPRGPRATTTANPAGLTPRELQVLQVLARGATDREIAGELHLSTKTVGHHVSAILSKLGVRNRREAAVRGMEVGALARAPSPPA